MRQVSRFLDDMMRDVTKEQIDARAARCRAATPATTARSRPPAGCSSRPAQLWAARCRTAAGPRRRQPDPRRRPWRCRSEQPQARVIAGLQGHQPAHQGRGPRRARRGLLQRQDASRTPTSCTPASTALPADFWEQHGKDMRSWKEGDRTFYELSGPAVRRLAAEPVRLRGQRRRASRPSCASIERRYGDPRAGARLPQRAAQRLGHHGAQPRAEFRAQPADGSRRSTSSRCWDRPAPARRCSRWPPASCRRWRRNRFVEIIMTRVTIPLGEDIGFLPGTEEEKMEPWMGALMDNLEVLTQQRRKAATGAAPPPTTCCATASRSAR